MSEANVDLVRRCVEIFNAGDLEPILELLDAVVAEDCELGATGRLPDVGRHLVGRDAIKDWFREVLGTFAYRTDAEEYIDAGDAVVVVCQQTARGRASGAETTASMVEVFGVRDGMVTYFDAYRTKREALAAVRLSE